MLANELKEIIDSFPSLRTSFLGVCSINTVPKLKKHNFVIVNTQDNTQLGEHWFCIIKKDLRKYEVFDSLGVSSDKLELYKQYNLFPNNSAITFNETNFQSPNSVTCGQFVLYFLINRVHNLDLSYFDLLNEIFSLDCLSNETNVLSFLKEHS